MKFQETKYQVDSLDEIKNMLEKLGARPMATISSTHYYVKKDGNDVVKLVEYSEKSEIHLLEELGGQFKLKENIPVAGKAEGFGWLKRNGFSEVGIIKMNNTDFTYKNGLVGLYEINGFLHSVILDFPAKDNKLVEKELGLDPAKKIEVPYNKLLDKIGKLKTVKL